MQSVSLASFYTGRAAPPLNCLLT